MSMRCILSIAVEITLGDNLLYNIIFLFDVIPLSDRLLFYSNNGPSLKFKNGNISNTQHDGGKAVFCSKHTMSLI